MAYVPQQIPPEEENKFARPDLTTPNPNAAPNTGGGTAPAGAGRPAPGMGTPTQFGSNASKLSDYLSANKEQVGEFGQKVAGDLSNRYNETMGAIDQGVGDFNQQVNSGYTPMNEDLVGSAAQNPNEFVKDPNKVSAFKSIYNDQYKGPENFESSTAYQNVNDQVNKAVENAGMLNTMGGVNSYLKNYMGTANNTPGMQTLDSALLVRSPEASQAIQQAASPYKNLTGYLGGKTADADTGVASAKQAADTARTSTQNRFVGPGGALPNLQTDLSKRLAETKGNQSAASDKAIADYQNGTATPEELKLLGFNTNDLSDNALSEEWRNAQALNNDYGVKTDWSGYFTKQSPDVVYSSPGTVATPEEISRSQALSTLTGNDLSGWMGNTSPTGPLITTNKEGLGQLHSAVSDRDTDNVLAHASQLLGVGDWNGSPAPDFASFRTALLQSGKTPTQIYNAALATGNTSLINAVVRMGLGSTPTAPTGPGPGGVVRAS